MLDEIDKNFYCSGDFNRSDKRYELGRCAVLKGNCGKLCTGYHRKWPTLEQYKKEYGKEWTGAVYVCLDQHINAWQIMNKKAAESYIHHENKIIVCACTPWGMPPDNWKPE